MIIYIDILIVTNIIINYFLLLLTAHYCSYETKRRSLLAASVIGGIYSLISLMTNMRFITILVLKLICCLVMTFILFGFRDLFRYYYIFLIINFIFSGLMLMLWFFISPPGMSVSNGVVYFNISTRTLVLSILISYIVINVFSIISKKVPINITDYSVTVCVGDRQVTVKGFVDTGNFLQDIFSATPVVICRFDAIKSILPRGFEEIVLNKNIEKNMYFSKLHVRFIPYQTVDNQQFIVAFKPDKFILKSSTNSFYIKDVYVGIILEDKFMNKNYDIILNPQLLKYNY